MRNGSPWGQDKGIRGWNPDEKREKGKGWGLGEDEETRVGSGCNLKKVDAFL
jgi:hypothetical protein